MFKIFEELVTPFPDGTPPPMPRGVVRFLWACTSGMRAYVAGVMLLTGAIGAFEAFLFSLLGRVIDLLSQANPETLWAAHQEQLIGLASILVASVLLIGIQSLLKQQTLSANFAMRLRWNFHRRMLEQNLSAFQDDFAGRIASSVMQTAVSVRDTWILFIDMLVFIVTYVVTIALIVGGFDATLLLPLTCWLVLTTIAVGYFAPRLSEAAKEQADANLLTAGRIADTYSNIATVKLFSHTNRETSYARSAMLEFLEKIRRQLRLVTTFELVSQVLSMLLIVSTIALALLLWTNGEVTIGAVAAAGAMALRLNGVSNMIMWQTASLLDQIGVVRVGVNALAREPTVRDRDGASPLHVTRGGIIFEGVTFQYTSSRSHHRPVIQDFNLEIQPGERIGLVGRSGAGKSTLVNLLLRFYDIEHGRILIDGQDIARVTQESLRSQIGMVTQDISLLNRSIRENILYGRPEASEREMMDAAKKAGIHEFVLTLSDQRGRDGYDVHVGERGVKLSGGQRQRIAIARVMLKNAPILLLDEATSALDNEIEATIRQSLYQLMEGKTMIAIAHRLSTIAMMNRLVVLDRGRVVEQGSHEHLLSQSGLYARLWAHHSGDFLGRG